MKTISLSLKVTGETWDDAIRAFEKAAELPIDESIEAGLMGTDGETTNEIHIDVGETVTVTHMSEADERPY